MKRIFLASIILLIVFLGGCNFICVDSSKNWKEEAQKLVNAFDSRDIESAENLFAKDIKEKVNLTKQLEEAFEFYNSESIDTEYNNVSGSYQRDDIDCNEEDVEVIIKTRETTFVFMISMYTLHSDTNLMGIRELTVSKDDSKKYVSVGTDNME